jgi:catechol 2,3-dioxygenase
MKPMQQPSLKSQRVTTYGGQGSAAFDGSATGRLETGVGRRDRQHAHLRKLRLGHVHLKVRNLNHSVPFYTRLLGLRLTERAGRYAFLSIGDEHHSVALEEVGGWSVNPSRRAIGVAHIAFEVPDRAAFTAMRNKLTAGHVPFISRNNGISLAIRFQDPDGNEIEIYVDRRHATGGKQSWGARWHIPLKLPREHVATFAAA